MGGQNSKQHIFSLLTDTVSSAVGLSGAIEPSKRFTQNFLLVWLDATIDESQYDCQNTLEQLRTIVNDVHIFTQPEQCLQFLNNIKNEKVFIIISGTLGQYFVPDIHALPQLDAIYIFCENQSKHESWIKEWSKVKGVYTEVKLICEELELATKQCNHDSIAMSFVSVNEVAFNQNLNQLEPSFMYTQIFKEILFDMKYDEESMKDLANYCRKFYNNNVSELNIINEFEHDYRLKSPIWWYTRECFMYQMLNRALRTLEGDTIIHMGVFIHDLHQQIEQLHQKQINYYHGKSFVVYREQGLLKSDFERLVKTKDGLISFNSFLSTSKKRKISFKFAKEVLKKLNMVGILFKMSIDPSISSTPFASIRKVSYFKTEDEVLFSMHTVFRVGDIIKISKKKLLYQVNLKLTADDDQQLRTLTDRIREEVVGETGWKRLGQLLIKLSQFDKAEELYNVLLEQTSDNIDKAFYYNQLGYIKGNQGDYEKAIVYYEKGYENWETDPCNQPSSATFYNNIGAMYNKNGEYPKALSFYEKALEIYQKTLPSTHPDLATAYNNIGTIFDSMREYTKALSSHEKALEIRRNTLPSNHPILATSYNNIGSVYDNMGQYSKALSFYIKALDIQQKTLLENHPDIAGSYNNIGMVYNKMGEYSKALSYFEKAFDILQKTHPPNHPDLSIFYNNIGLVYDNMGEYLKALSFYEKDLENCQNTLPSNHPLLASSYNNIGLVYKNMEEYSKALSSLEKALEIYQKTLPSNHPSLATSYNNIGLVYNSIEDYPKAISFYDKALQINQKTLPVNHPDFAYSYNNIGSVYSNMKEYSKALSSYQNALKIFAISLPSNHPNIQTVQKNIEYIKRKL